RGHGLEVGEEPRGGERHVAQLRLHLLRDREDQGPGRGGLDSADIQVGHGSGAAERPARRLRDGGAWPGRFPADAGRPGAAADRAAVTRRGGRRADGIRRGWPGRRTRPRLSRGDGSRRRPVDAYDRRRPALVEGVRHLEESPVAEPLPICYLDGRYLLWEEA